jgi:hypothetical protein
MASAKWSMGVECGAVMTLPTPVEEAIQVFVRGRYSEGVRRIHDYFKMLCERKEKKDEQ